MINSCVPNDIVVGKGSVLMGCDIVVRGGLQLTKCWSICKALFQSVLRMPPNVLRVLCVIAFHRAIH